MYKVIEIVDSYHIIINYGTLDNAKKGDCLRIYEPGEPVTDLETGESLGVLDLIKETVEVVTVYERFSICQKITRTKMPMMGSLSQWVHTSESTHELNINEGQVSNRTITGNPIISVGDLAETC